MNRHAATRRMRWDVEFAPGAQAAVEGDAVWRKVNSLEHEDWAGHVYNLEVEGDHSYVAEGVGVHNCVGFGSSMMMSLLNKRRYAPRWLWNESKKIDEWADTNPGDDNGTSVRASCDVLRDQGHVRLLAGRERPVSADEGIAANRWATTVDEMRVSIAGGIPISIGVSWYQAFDTPQGSGMEVWIAKKEQNLGAMRGGHCVCVYGASDRRQAFRVKNSWGRGYPLGWLDYSVMQRLLDEDGEATMVTDR